jgi:hypothetical protein
MPLAFGHAWQAGGLPGSEGIRSLEPSFHIEEVDEADIDIQVTGGSTMGLIMFTVGLILAFGGAVAQVLVSEDASLRASWVMGRYTVVVVGIVLIVLGLHSMLLGNGFAPNLPGR